MKKIEIFTVMRSHKTGGYTLRIQVEGRKYDRPDATCRKTFAYNDLNAADAYVRRFNRRNDHLGPYANQVNPRKVNNRSEALMRR